jgi:alpha-ribazole phosphatase
MELLLIRHTAVEFPAGVSSLCYGQTDVPLAASFEREAERVLNKLEPFTVHGAISIVSSPLMRCKRLAERVAGQHVAGHCSAKLTVDTRLQEMNFGAWEGSDWNTLPTDEVTAWMNDFVHTAPPGGESFQDLARRVVAAFNDLMHSAPPNTTLVLVTHAGVIRALLASVLEMPLHKAPALTIDYGGISALRCNAAGSTVRFVNR